MKLLQNNQCNSGMAEKGSAASYFALTGGVFFSPIGSSNGCVRVAALLPTGSQTAQQDM